MTMTNEDSNEVKVISNRDVNPDSVNDIYFKQVLDKKPRMRLMKDSKNKPESEKNGSRTHTKKDEK